VAVIDGPVRSYFNLVSFFFSVQMHLTYSFTAEADKAKENAKREATQRAEQRKKKKDAEQLKAARREQSRSKNRRNGKPFWLFLCYRGC
jgi:hypothetical protein